MPSRWEPDVTAFERLDAACQPDADRIVFTGSSTIRFWTTLHLDFPGAKVVNRGFGGARVRDVAELLARVVGSPPPSAVIMYAGGNDLASLRKVDELTDDAKCFLEAARSLSDTIDIGLMSVIPHRRFWPIIKQITDYNANLGELAQTDRLHFLDVAAPMLEAGEPPPARLFIDDEIHLSAAGYQVLVDEVRPFVGRVAQSVMSS